ncbi:hypothetical protein VTG60DRAFT_6546 [Thermothelomyces hinnuleus]
MAANSRSGNAFVAFARKVYHPIGFSKGYNFVLFFIFAGAFTGFTLARLQYLAIDRSCESKGADQPLGCYYYTRGSIDRIGIILHLATILPGSLLVILQFVPIIRRSFVLFHRINGYLIIILSLVSTAGAIMLARNSVGGRTEVQTSIGVLSIAFVVCLALAWYNIKRLQIEQHRAWMLRAWFYAGSIVTVRPILFLMALITSNDDYFVPMPCAKVASLISKKEQILQDYPACESYFTHGDTSTNVLVPATMAGNGSNRMASFSHNFGAALWLALALHAVGVEIYLRLTPAEANRLRNVSYQRQLEAGMKSPGRAGLTADRLGDSDLWKPNTDQNEQDGIEVSK